MDPYLARPVGSGEEKTAVTLAAACNLALLDDAGTKYPGANDNPQTCGDVVQLPFTSVAPGEKNKGREGCSPSSPLQAGSLELRRESFCNNAEVSE